jgi:hypothetical protein
VSPAETLYCLPPVLITANNSLPSYSMRPNQAKNLPSSARYCNAAGRRMPAAGHLIPKLQNFQDLDWRFANPQSRLYGGTSGGEMSPGL